MARRRVVVVSGRQRPHEVLLLGLSALTGVAYLFGSPPPNSLAALLPAWQVDGWAAGMLISGTVGLVGCYWRGDIRRGLELERGALLLQSAATILYAFVLLAAFGWQAALAAGTTIAWSAANIIRVTQINQDLRAVCAARRGNDE